MLISQTLTEHTYCLQAYLLKDDIFLFEGLFAVMMTFHDMNGVNLQGANAGNVNKLVIA